MSTASIDALKATAGVSDSVKTHFGTMKGLVIGAAEVSVRINLYIPGLSIPSEELIFRINEVFFRIMACMWHVVDPEAYARIAESDAKDEAETMGIEPHERFVGNSIESGTATYYGFDEIGAN